MGYSMNVALVLPYFGKFNSYFDLFLESCRTNPSYDWLILTDNCNGYDFPANVHVVKSSLEEIRKLADKKFGFSVSLDTPYKLCDFKPAYGFLFEELLKDYDYWGHCDCDLLFGNLEKILTPVLCNGYDKVFAAGHLTLYRNTSENNRRFMKPHNGVEIYKEAYTTSAIYVFDEDCQMKHHTDNNVHSIFLEDGAKVFADDLSMNVSGRTAKFVRSAYDSVSRQFVCQLYQPARYYWRNDELFALVVKKESEELERKDYLYIHLQSRKMRNKVDREKSDCIEILPDRFISVSKIPQSVRQIRKSTIGFPYCYWLDVYEKKLKRRISKILNG